MPSTPHPIADGRFGPPLQGGRPRSGGPDWRRLAAWAASLLGVFILVVAMSAAAVLWYGTSAIERVDIPSLSAPGSARMGAAEAAPAEPEELTDVLNVLLVGSDSRAGLTGEQLVALGTEEADGLRTDTIMLAQLDPRRDKVAVLSFPRDLLLTRCDGSRGRINSAYGVGEATGVGGPTCLVETVTDFTGIPINHFIQMDFAGFIDVVDALGGVSMYLEEPILDRYAGVDLPAGCVEMDGPTALGFVRVRRIDNDFGRIARQQRFIHELVSEAASVGTLVNLPRLFSLVDAGARAVETDRGLSITQMRRIAFSLRNLSPEALDTRTVPATPRQIGGAAYVVADEDESEALFSAFRDGDLVPDGLGTEEAEPVGMDDVPPLLVLNGAGVAGLAQEATSLLEDEGLTVAGIGNAESFDVVRTRVVHPEERLEEAELVAEALGGAELVLGEPGEELTVVLGLDWGPGGLDAEDGSGEDADDAPSPGPTPTPTPTAPPEPEFVGATPNSC